MTPGTWLDLSTVGGIGANTTIQSVFPSPTPPGATGPAAVTLAYSGGAFDTTNNRLMAWGGGHTDYGGNEVYEFFPTDLQWHRVWGPTPNAQITTSSDVYADGNPASRHTEAALSFGNGKFYSTAGCNYSSCNQIQSTWVLDIGSLTWTAQASPSAQINQIHVNFFNPNDGNVYVEAGNTASQGALFKYTVATNTWSCIPVSCGAAAYSTGLGSSVSGSFDYVNNRLFIANGGQPFYYRNILTGAGAALSPTGTMTCPNSEGPLMVFYPKNTSSLCVDTKDGDPNVYEFNDSITSPAITTHVATGGPPAENVGGQATMGRGQWDAFHGVLIVCTGYNHAVFVYKPNF